MKRYIKLKIGREVTGNMITYSYPDDYNPELISVIAYESFNPENIPEIEARGGDYEYLIAALDDIHQSNKRLMNLADCLELDQSTAESKCSAYIIQNEVVTDRDSVLLVLAKYARGEDLTEAEVAVIDPNNPALGINNPPSIAEMIISIEV